MKQKLLFKVWLYFHWVFIPIILITSSTLYSQNGWVQQISGTTNDLNCVSFVNINTGFAGGTGGLILKTTNGGINWQSINIDSYSNISRIQFLNVISGYVSSSSGIKKSTNGGLNWISTSWAGTKPISFVDTSTGFTFYNPPYGNECIYTSNGGLNWNNVGSFGTGYPTMLDIFFINSQTGYMSGSECYFYGHYEIGYAVIGKTINGGLNWNYSLRLGSNCNSGFVNKLFFLNDSFGVAVGHNGDEFLKTTNAGLNWSWLQVPSKMNSIYFVTVNNGLMCGDLGIILLTSDGGNNWLNQNLNVNSNFEEISMVNQYTGWVVGTSGKIFKTTTGGIIGFQNINSDVPEYFALYQNYPNPFNPITKIMYDLPNAAKVKIIVYDILGREVIKLVNNELKKPGRYYVEFNGNNYASGVYFYRIEAGEFVLAKKMVLLK
jgi:photosystem II stability/assembly factor-like uncharacterized protein